MGDEEAENRDWFRIRIRMRDGGVKWGNNTSFAKTRFNKDINAVSSFLWF